MDVKGITIAAASFPFNVISGQYVVQYPCTLIKTDFEIPGYVVPSPPNMVMQAESKRNIYSSLWRGRKVMECPCLAWVI